MSCWSLLSTEPNSETAINSVLERLGDSLNGRPADLGVVFVSPHHVASFERLVERISALGLVKHLIGCTGEAIVGDDREVENAPALSLWAIRLPGVELHATRLASGVSGTVEPQDPWPVETEDQPFLIVLGDPFTFPMDSWLKQLDVDHPGVRVLGGMASAGHLPGENRLTLDGKVYRDGAVGVLLRGRHAIRTIVSQGCRPIGRPMLVTRAEANIIHELGRRPALEVLKETFEALDPDEQALVRSGLHLGRVINEYQETFGRGDFLVRNVLGADEAGGIGITDQIRVGVTVQFHVRDAETADEDLRGLLAEVPSANPPAGALLMTCNGRGTRMFPKPNHDVQAIHDAFGPIPVAGFFAMGEVGPIGGKNFVHGFTASIALFESTE